MMCTPSLAVSGLPWIDALGGLGRSRGTATGQLVGLDLLGLGHGGGAVGVTAGANDVEGTATESEPDPPQAESTAARAASARHDAPRVRSMCELPSLRAAGADGVRRLCNE